MVIHMDLSASIHSSRLHGMSLLINRRVARRVVNKLMRLRLRRVVHCILILELHVRGRTFTLCIWIGRWALALSIRVGTIDSRWWRGRNSLLRNRIV